MKQRKTPIRDGCITLGILALCFIAGVLMQNVFDIPEQITTTFAFGVFLISLLTDGYFLGLAAALISVVLVNYAFTFPYFAIDFESPSNFYSALVMTVIALLTGTLTTKVKQQEALKAGYEVRNADFFKIGIPFTLAAIIPAYIYLWIFYGI